MKTRTRLDRPSFSLYRDHERTWKRTGKMLPSRNVSLRTLLKVKSLWARAENSGSEGCYVEVAKWNFVSNRWERFAFEKFFGGEMWDDLGDEQTAMRVAAIINLRNKGNNLCRHGRQWHRFTPEGGHQVFANRNISVVKVQQQEVNNIIHSFPSWNPIRLAA